MYKILTVLIPTTEDNVKGPILTNLTQPEIEVRIIGGKRKTTVAEAIKDVAIKRNVGLISRTPWITFLDDDDTWLSDHWTQLYPTMLSVEDKVQVLITLPTEFPHIKDSANLLRYLIHMESIPICSITMRKNCFVELGGFNISLPHSDVWDLLLRCYLLHGIDSIVILSKHTWKYNMTRTGLATMLAKDPNINVFEDRRKWLSQYAL